MRLKRRIFHNIILPVMVLIPLIWIMTGCLYIPFFEHRIDTGPNVRGLVGSANSDRPIRPGHITREKVIALLGVAPWRSDDGSALGYEAYTGVASWVYPLCFFAAEPADAKVYVVRLVFSKDGNLIRYDWADESQYVEPRLLFGFGITPPGNSQAAVRKLNANGPELKSKYERNQDRRWQATNSIND